MKNHEETVDYNGYEIRLKKKDNFTDAYFMSIYKDDEYCMAIKGHIPYDQCMEVAKKYIDTQLSLTSENGIRIHVRHLKNTIFETFKDFQNTDKIEENINDPVLVAMRVAKMKREKDLKKWAADKKKRVYGKKREELEAELTEINYELSGLYQDKRDILSDMDLEAGERGEDWTDDEANEYGERLNKVDDEITTLKNRRNEIEIKLNY